MAVLPWSVTKRIIISGWHDLIFLGMVILYCLAYFGFSFYCLKWSTTIPTYYLTSFLLLYPAWMSISILQLLHRNQRSHQAIYFRGLADLAGRRADNVFIVPVLCLLAIFLVAPLVSVPMCCYLAGAVVWKIFVKTPAFTIAAFRNSSIYSSTSLGSGQIRLLKLFPGNGHDNIRCQLHTADLADARYEALSYTWGSGIPRHKLEVDGFPFYVGSNLYTVLHYLRSPKDTRVMWIDAICINQADIAEREAQVKLMRRIYQQASTVIIWLGKPRDRHIGLGMEYVSRMARAAKTDVNETWIESEKWQKSVNKMLQNPWWDRAWVVQEAFLARRGIVQCGHYQVPFDDLCNFITNPAIIGRLAGLKSFAVFNLATTVQGAQNAVGDPQYGMLAIAYRFRQRIATDSRDKLYAVMGLLDNEKDYLIPVNYSNSDESVFQEFAKAAINRYGNLLVVALAAENSSKASWCPSWSLGAVPWAQYLPDYFNFQAWEETSPFWRGGLDEPRWYPLQVPDRYLAAGGHPAMCRTDLGPGLLSVKGYTYDVVMTVGSDPALQIFTSWRTLLREWEREAFQSLSGPGTEKLLAFNRTITANIPDTPIANWREWAPTTRRRWKWWKAAPREPREAGIQDLMKAACTNRRFFATSNGTFGLGPSSTAVGDPVCILLGSDVPFVLETVKRSNLPSTQRNEFPPEAEVLHKIKGQAYVDGAMVYDGNIKQDIADGKIKLKEFFLV